MIEERHFLACDINRIKVLKGCAFRDDDAVSVVFGQCEIAAQLLVGECTYHGVVADGIGKLHDGLGVLELKRIEAYFDVLVDRIRLHFGRMPQRIGKRAANDIAVIIFIVHKVALQAVHPFIVFDAVVVGVLIDELGHEQVEQRVCRYQTYHVERRRQPEATRHIYNVIDNLFHLIVDF